MTHSFKKTWYFFLPCSFGGWALTLSTLFLMVATFVFVDRSSHSVSDTLIGAVPLIIFLFILFQLVASHLSK